MPHCRFPEAPGVAKYFPRAIERRQGRSKAARFSLKSGGCHAAAFIRAATAGLGTFLAVLGLVLAAFLAACLAHICACLADGCRELAAAAHVSGGRTADLGTIHIEGNAACHHFDVLLLQARSGAMVAGDCAGVAGTDAGLKLLM
jgi:hypothetical protein